MKRRLLLVLLIFIWLIPLWSLPTGITEITVLDGDFLIPPESIGRIIPIQPASWTPLFVSQEEPALPEENL